VGKTYTSFLRRELRAAFTQYYQPPQRLVSYHFCCWGLASVIPLRGNTGKDGRYLLGDLIIALIRMYMFRVLFYSGCSGVKLITFVTKKNNKNKIALVH